LGNRGILHDESKSVRRTHAHQNWVTCALSFKGRKQELMAPGRYTQLFFLDEVTSLSAGHRPCATCRRDRYRSFTEAWKAIHGTAEPGRSLPQTIDRVLHRARISRGEKVTFRARLKTLPNGTIFVHSGQPALVWHGNHHRWFFSGYEEFGRLPDEDVDVLTPKPIVDLFLAGWVPSTLSEHCNPGM